MPAKSSHTPFGVFISHSHADREGAETLVTCLKTCLGSAERIRCTSVPGLDLKISQEVRAAIIDDLRTCKVVVSLVTRNSLRQEWPMFELSIAIAFGKPLCILLGPGIQSADLPGPFEGFLPKSLEAHDAMPNLLDKLAEILSCKRFAGREYDNALHVFWKHWQRTAGPELKPKARRQRKKPGSGGDPLSDPEPSD